MTKPVDLNKRPFHCKLGLMLPHRGKRTPGRARGFLLFSAALAVVAALPVLADITLPVSTQEQFTIRGYNPGYGERTVVYRFTPAGSSVGGSNDTLVTDTVPSHAVHVQTFPAGTGMITEEPQINPSTGEPYDDLALEGQTYDNGTIQSLEQITTEALANKRPLVGRYGDELYILTGDTGGRVVLSQFTEDGVTNVQMTSALPAHALIPLNLATVFGGSKAPVSLESYDGVQFTAVMKDACNGEYHPLSGVDVSPRVAAAIKESMPTTSTGKILLTQQFSQLVMHDYFAPFIQNMLTYDASARALFQNNPDLAQQWATQRSDGIAVKKENPEIVSIKIKLGKGKISFITDKYSSVRDCVTGALNLSGNLKPRGLENSLNGAAGMADIYGNPVAYFGKAIQENLPLTNNLATMAGAYNVKNK